MRNADQTIARSPLMDSSRGLSVRSTDTGQILDLANFVARST
jgi:hypothetical protein